MARMTVLDFLLFAILIVLIISVILDVTWK